MNRYDRPIRNTEQQLDHIYYYTLFHRCTALLLVSFTSRGNNYAAEPKPPFPKPNRHTFGFSSSNFTVQDHILSTAGDALTLNLYHITNFKERERERRVKERKKALKLSGTCRLNAMKEQRTSNCLLGLCTSQKKKLLSLIHPPSPNFYFILFFFDF
jgi:hypothetical protein